MGYEGQMKRYREDFYNSLDDAAAPSARIILPMLLQHVSVTSAVDIGCGDGGWLAVLHEYGVADILGVDGPWHSGQSLKIPSDSFQRVPLDNPLQLRRCFDLAMSLEVAEHLPPDRATDFVAELTGLAPVVLFSAAIPGQGGFNHFNEQWPAYWAELFAAHDYVAIDLFRPAIWNDARIAWWYKQNILLYVKRDRLDAMPGLHAAVRKSADILPLIHPEPWARTLRLSQPRIGRWLRMLPAVLQRTF
jgi:hypothetical protein